MNTQDEKDKTEGRFFYWPQVTKDDEDGREWIHPQPPRYYLKQDKETKKWCVVDRASDFSVTKQYSRRRDCIRGFYIRMGDQLGLNLYKIK